MKNLKSIVLVIMLVFVLLFTGCGAKDYITDAQDELDDYYMNYNDGYYDDIIDTIHPALLDLMSEEDFAAFFEARTYYYGLVDDYKIVGTEISYENGVTYVELEVDTDYESGNSFTEVFEYVFEEKGEPQMIAIDAPIEE